MGRVADVVIDFPARRRWTPCARMSAAQEPLWSPVPPDTPRSKSSAGGLGERGAGSLECQLLPGRGGVRPGPAGGERCSSRILTSRSPRPTKSKADAPSGTAKLLLEAIDPQHTPDACLRPGGHLRPPEPERGGHPRPAGRHRGRNPPPSTSSAPTRSFPSLTGLPAARSLSAVRCTWPGCWRESPPGYTTCKKSYLESDL